MEEFVKKNKSILSKSVSEIDVQSLKDNANLLTFTDNVYK